MVLRAVPEDNEYGVRLVWHGEAELQSATFVYRGDELPSEGQVITVELVGRLERLATASPVPPQSRRARVTKVIPDDDYPIRATELEP
jgi:hypothetical protein